MSGIKGSQSNAAIVVTPRYIPYSVFVIEYRRKVAIGRVAPDGIWHRRGADFPNEDYAKMILADISKMSGAYQFDFRIRQVERQRLVGYEEVAA